MKKAISLIATLLVSVAVGVAQPKPTILIAGNGNISINSTGQGAGGINGGVVWAGEAPSHRSISMTRPWRWRRTSCVIALALN